MAIVKSISILILVCIVAVLIISCSPPTTNDTFRLGDEVAPPYGCVELRERGGEC